MKASEGIKPAPFTNRARVVDKAAKEQELEIKPKKVPNATLLGPVFPMDFCILSLVTKTWIIEPIQAHGFFRPMSNPYENSGLVVSDGRGVPIRDGDVTRLLTPSMINKESPNLSNSHVTLGACVSGQGLEGQGGDVLGLEMTLRLCNASSVMASHWDVNTEMMATFCHHFYDNWVNKKMSRAAAWRKVILEDIPTIDVPILCVFSLFGDWR